MSSPTLTEQYRRVRAGLEYRRRDPLAYWHFAVPRLRRAFSMFTREDPVDELLARACNKGTKTETMAAFGLACMQKREHLDGVRIPQWRGRVEAVQLVLDYKQQLLSVQPAWERMLGGWPNHVRKEGSAFSSIHVMPVGGDPDDEHDWSVVHFLSQKNLTTGTGVRGDVILFDEPPVMAILQELRKAAHAGRPAVTVIGMTPTIRRQYQPIRDDYGDTRRRTLRRVDQDRAEVRWSLDEVASWVLSESEKASLIRKYVGEDPTHPRDPLAMARIHGDYCITEGSCPFHLPTLQKMRKECKDPEIVQWRITQEADERSGRARVVRSVPVEIFGRFRTDRTYWVTIDPSSGTEDAMHDPYELEVTEDGTGDLILRSGGYLAGHLVGVLATGIARQANNAQIDVEVNDRWGVNVVEGVYSCGYANFAREMRLLKNGESVKEIGFHNNQNTRPLIIGAVQRWIDAWRAGIRYGRCPSRFVLDTLMDCVLDQDGKIVGAPGVHDDALIVRGQALRRAVRRHGMDVPEYQEPYKTRDQELLERMFGDPEDPYDRGEVVEIAGVEPRPRPSV